MVAPFRTGELFGDGAGGAQALTLAMAAGAGGGVLTDHQVDLVLDIDPTGGTAATAIEFEVQDSLDGVTWRTAQRPIGLNAAGTEIVTEAVYRAPGDVASRYYVRVHHETWVRVRARRVGGAVDTTVYIYAEAREPGWIDRLGGAAAGGGGGGGGSVADPFVPVDGGGQAINIAAASVASAQLTVGIRYDVYAEAPCYWTTGGAAVAATTADSFLPAGLMRQITIQEGEDYIAVIRDTVNVTGGFHICEASR